MVTLTDYQEQRRFFIRFAALYVPWFVLTTLLAALPLSPTGMARFIICTAALVVPVVVFAVAYQLNPSLRAYVFRIDLSLLHFFQIARLAGIGMLAVYAVGRLAPLFALWAGGVDVIIGLTATFMAFLALVRDRLPRRMLTAWNVLGLLDFVVALVLWFLYSPTVFGVLGHQLDTTQMLILPLSFIPMAGVPVASIVHIIALIQLRSTTPRAPHPVLYPA